MKNPYDKDLKLVASQARRFAVTVDKLNDLFRQQADAGQITPTSSDLRAAKNAMNAAFLAVLRVTSSYL